MSIDRRVVHTSGLRVEPLTFLSLGLATAETVQPVPITLQLSILAIHCKTLNKLIPACYLFLVFAARQPRRSLRSENVQTCQHSNAQTSLPPNFFPCHTSKSSLPKSNHCHTSKIAQNKPCSCRTSAPLGEMSLVKSESGQLSLAPFSCFRHVTKNPSPQPLQNQQLQTVTPATPLESAFTKTAGCHPLFLPSFRSLRKERSTTSLQSKGCALFLKTAGCPPTLPILERVHRPDTVGQRSRGASHFHFSRVMSPPRLGQGACRAAKPRPVRSGLFFCFPNFQPLTVSLQPLPSLFLYVVASLLPTSSLLTNHGTITCRNDHRVRPGLVTPADRVRIPPGEQ
jgi:hypothetical protein